MTIILTTTTTTTVMTSDDNNSDCDNGGDNDNKINRRCSLLVSSYNTPVIGFMLKKKNSVV
jgi:hypothetical protein